MLAFTLERIKGRNGRLTQGQQGLAEPEVLSEEQEEETHLATEPSDLLFFPQYLHAVTNSSTHCRCSGGWRRHVTRRETSLAGLQGRTMT